MSFRTLAVISAALIALVPSAPVPAQQPGSSTPVSLFSELEMAEYRPAPCQPNGGGRRAPQPSVHVLHGPGERRRLEDHRRGPHLEADLRRPADRLDRRPSSSRHRMPTSSMSAAGKACTVPTCRPATASTSRRDAGKTWTHLGLQRRAADPDSSTSIRATPTACSSRPSAIPMDPTKSAASSAPPTAAARSRRSSTRTRTPAATTSTSIRPIRTSSTRRCGKSGRGRGRTRCGPAPAAASSSPPTAAPRGASSTNGLPQVIQANLAISPANPKRIYAAVAGAPDAGDARTGARQQRDVSQRRRRRELEADHARTRARPDASAAVICRCRCRIRRIPDILISASTVSWKSTDGGVTWAAFKGAPGGEDYQNGWINPDNPDIMIFGVDQGAVVTLNGGETLELLVQPVDRADVSRRRRQRLPLPGLQRPAGERIRVRLEPRQLRRGLASRLDAGRRRRVRLRRAGSAEPRHRLRRPQRDALRPPHRAGLERRADRRPRRRRRSARDVPDRCARCRSCSRRSTSGRCSSPTTISGRR